MKRSYEKPVLTKRDSLVTITATEEDYHDDFISPLRR